MTANQAHSVEPVTPGGTSRAAAPARCPLHLVDAIAANTLAVLAPLLMFRYVMLKAFQTFNLRVSAGELWANLPAMVWRDLATALGVGVVLAVPMYLGTCSRTRWVRLPLIVTARAALPLAVVLIAGLYAVYLDVGFFPTWSTIVTHLSPGSPLLKTARAHLTAENAAFLAVLIVFPLVIRWLCLRYCRAARGVAAAALVVLVAGWLWPVPATLTQAAAHPISQVYDGLVRVEPDWDLARWSDRPFSHASLSGTAASESFSHLAGTLADCNVLLVILESTGRCYLHDDQTGWRFPNLQRLAAAALDFSSYYTSGDSSLPSLFAIFAARSPVPLRDSQWYYPSGGRVLWPAELKRRGYRTGFFHSGSFEAFFDRRLFEAMAWDVLEDAAAVAAARSAATDTNARLGETIDERVTAERVHQWIGNCREAGQRSLACYFTAIPHLPYDSADAADTALHRGPSQLTHRQQYENELAYVDAVVGELYDRLLADGFFEDGALVVVADHGEAFGQHPGVVVHSTHVYQETVHVPLLVVNPLRFDGAVIANPGSHVDLWPTVADLLGLATNQAAEGRSLLRRTDRSPMVWHRFATGAADRLKTIPTLRQMVFVASVENGIKLGVIDGRFKYFYDRRQDRAELFDLGADPGETHDLSADRPDLIAGYHDWVHTFVAWGLGGAGNERAVAFETHLRLGHERLAEGKLEAAYGHFAEALEIDPESAEARAGLADVQSRQGEASPTSAAPRGGRATGAER